MAEAALAALRAELVSVAERLQLSEQHGVRTASELDKLRLETDTALREASNQIAELKTKGGGDRADRLDLVDVKSMQPQVFSGHQSESYKQWAKKVRAFCNARKPGFRKALEWAEQEARPIDDASLSVLSWAPAEDANQKLFDLLVMHLSDDPLILVENHQGQGFEAWRALSRRYDPVGEQFVFDRMTNLMHRDRCVNISELPASIGRWIRELQMYERKTGKTMDPEWRVPVLFQMVPKVNYVEIKSRWTMVPDGQKDIMKFAHELMSFANELQHDHSKMNGKGPSPMDVDLMDKENRDWTAAEWEDWAYAEQTAEVDWLGKGGKKGKKGGSKGKKGGSKGKGQGNCHWCDKPGHTKAECREFKRWKDEKDADRKKRGLPPFQPRGVAAVEPGGEGGNGSDYEQLLGGHGAGMLDIGSLGCDALGVVDSRTAAAGPRPDSRTSRSTTMSPRGS